MILFVHNRYRTAGGEERAVEDLCWLVREHLGEHAEVLERDSASVGRSRAAAGLVYGGLAPHEVAEAVRRTGARIVHAHNVLPTLGWRGLAAARRAGARVVLHLHNYRLVCAVGTCFTRGGDCMRCHGRDTRPGVRLRCRGSAPEAVVYGAALSLWQRRVVAQADRIVVPSTFALQRLLEIGAPIDPSRVDVVGHLVRRVAHAPDFDAGGPVLFVGRLAPEKGADVAIDACRAAGRALVIAGDGPERARLQRQADGGDVRFVGRVGTAELTRLRSQASLAIVPSRSAETFGLAAVEAMAAGLPVVASRIGALTELVADSQLVTPGDAAALATAVAAAPGAAAAEEGLTRARALAAPERVASRLAEAYATAVA